MVAFAQQLADTSAFRISPASVATFTYNNAGRELTRTLGNGLVATRTYRNDGLLATLNTTGLGDDLAYTYDANKNPTSETRTGVMSPYSWSTPANGFDELDRLTSWSRTNGNTQTWTLTASNNWQSTVVNGTNENRTHSPAHEIAAVGSLNQVHDVKGNLTRWQRTSTQFRLMSYDQDNQLSQFDGTGDAKPVLNHAYDALGRKVGRSQVGQTWTLVSVHNGPQVIAEYNNTFALTKSNRKFVYGPRYLGT